MLNLNIDHRNYSYEFQTVTMNSDSLICLAYRDVLIPAQMYSSKQLRFFWEGKFQAATYTMSLCQLAYFFQVKRSSKDLWTTVYPWFALQFNRVYPLKSPA